MRKLVTLFWWRSLCLPAGTTETVTAHSSTNARLLPYLLEQYGLGSLGFMSY